MQAEGHHIDAQVCWSWKRDCVSRRNDLERHGVSVDVLLIVKEFEMVKYVLPDKSVALHQIAIRCAC